MMMKSHTLGPVCSLLACVNMATFIDSQAALLASQGRPLHTCAMKSLHPHAAACDRGFPVCILQTPACVLHEAPLHGIEDPTRIL